MTDHEVALTLRQVDALAAARTCPLCDAGPGEACRVRSTGRPTPYGNHSARDKDLWRAFRLGRERERLAATEARLRG